MRERQLHWVQRNHSRRNALDSVSTMLEGFMRSGRVSRMRRRCLIVDVVVHELGPERMRLVAWLEQRGDTLVLRVNSAADCYTLGIRWGRRLLHALQYQAPAAGIREVRFLPAEADGN